MKTDKALKVVTDDLKKDKEMFYAWQSNIAMQFCDAHSRFQKKSGKQALSKQDIHKVANEAAKEFLNLLCK